MTKTFFTVVTFLVGKLNFELGDIYGGGRTSGFVGKIYWSFSIFHFSFSILLLT